MNMRVLPALLCSLALAAPVAAQSVTPDQPPGLIEGREGEALVLAAGSAAGIVRSYRVQNLGDGDVSVGAGDEFYDLRAGNTLDFLVGTAPLQATFRDDAELEFFLIALSPTQP